MMSSLAMAAAPVGIANPATEQKQVEVEIIDSDEESIDEDQLTEFREQLISLGSFAVRPKKRGCTCCDSRVSCIPIGCVPTSSYLFYLAL
jgi:hypothetical protein